MPHRGSGAWRVGDFLGLLGSSGVWLNFVLALVTLALLIPGGLMALGV
jgi:hypothetical protein